MVCTLINYLYSYYGSKLLILNWEIVSNTFTFCLRFDGISFQNDTFIFLYYLTNCMDNLPIVGNRLTIDRTDIFSKLSKTGRIVVGIEISRDQQVSFPRNMGFADSFEMSVGLPVAQARPSSGLV